LNVLGTIVAHGLLSGFEMREPSSRRTTPFPLRIYSFPGFPHGVECVSSLLEVHMQRFLLLSVALLFFAAISQAKDVQLVGDPSVPAAKGQVNTSKDKNGNVRVKVIVRHLAKPTSLTPAKQAYVVWVQGKAAEPEKVGMLQVNNNLEGSLEGTTPQKEFDIFITAENDPSVQVPTGTRLLHGTVVD
jgi:hypothetical protein